MCLAFVLEAAVAQGVLCDLARTPWRAECTGAASPAAKGLVATTADPLRSVEERPGRWRSGSPAGRDTSRIIRASTPVPTNDIWIAATAARHGATVVTYDGHFASIQRVGTILLQRG